MCNKIAQGGFYRRNFISAVFGVQKKSSFDSLLFFNFLILGVLCLKTTLFLGDPGGARTLDPMIKSHLLYQLSYGVIPFSVLRLQR